MVTNNLPGHIQSLLEPGAYDHDTDRIELIQTHISWVILTGHFAYKIKKPVNLGFLDFSSLTKRKKACMDELKLNRRLAADIYLDVVAIYKGDKNYYMNTGSDGDLQPFDYALKMVQFDQDDLLDNRLTQAELNRARFDPHWMDILAITIASFHNTAETSSYISQFGTPDYLRHHIDENLRVAEDHPQAERLRETLSNLKKRNSRILERLDNRIIQRQQAMHIRNCHGDLHLKNITLFHDKPLPFDCIEFSDEFRMIDTMNDVAFLVMDCEARGHPELGYRFLSRYLEQSGDYTGLCLLHLYLSYRAGVRGKVSCLLADSTTLSTNEQERLIKDVEHYFLLAERYLQPQQPNLIAVGGLSGSGKSYLALQALQHICTNEGTIIIRSDATRKRIATEHAELPLYGDEMHKLAYQTMFDAAETTLNAGFSVILDATFLEPSTRAHACALARSLQVPFSFYWLDIDTDTLRERIKRRTTGDSDISDADISVLEAQLTSYTPPEEPWIQFIDDSGYWPPQI